jgi:MoxR-like ATPase
MELYTVPGISETLDWVAALAALDRTALDAGTAEATLGVALKAKEDIDAVLSRDLTALVARVTSDSDRR